MKILLIRHAEQDYPRNSEGKQLVATPTAPLTSAGELQARQLGEKLKSLGEIPDTLFVSPYKRTQQTGKILQRTLGARNLVTMGDLKDVFPNDSEGHTLEELAAIGSDVYAHPFGSNQETMNHIFERAAKTFRAIVTNALENGLPTVAIVSHGDVLSAMYWSLFHENIPKSYSEMRSLYYPKKAEAFIFDYIDGQVKDEHKIEVAPTAFGIERLV